MLAEANRIVLSIFHYVNILFFLPAVRGPQRNLSRLRTIFRYYKFRARVICTTFDDA